MSQKWFPLESNPDVMNKYIASLGLKGENIQFCDVFGTDVELLGMVPGPRHAVVFLYPITDENEAWNNKRVEEATASGAGDEGLFFCKQTISNACGTIGIIHSLVNNGAGMEFSDTGFLHKFVESTKGMNSSERAAYLEKDEELEKAQDTAAQEGQSANQDRSADINLHFIAFVHHNGGLYEMDGRKPIPIKCGPTTPETLLEDTASFAKKYMALNPDNVNFTLVSLSSV